VENKSVKIIVYLGCYFVLLLLISYGCDNRNKTKDSIGEKGVRKTDTLRSRPEVKGNQALQWKIDEKASAVTFTISNFGKEVQGSIGGLEGAIFFDEKDLKNSTFDTRVKVKTIDTGISKRDKDLMNEKYFDESKFPEITFKSDKIERSGKDFSASGNLTIKGKTLPIQMPFTFERKESSGIFKSQFTIKRLDYGIGGTGPIMGKDVNVNLIVVAKE
jgi:polyisoprenoid-binding protein YceI